jgi:hypothetical protein
MKKSNLLLLILIVWSLCGGVLLLLKVCGVYPMANWSWWRITAPVWGQWALVLMAYAAHCLVGLEPAAKPE